MHFIVCIEVQVLKAIIATGTHSTDGNHLKSPAISCSINLLILTLNITFPSHNSQIHFITRSKRPVWIRQMTLPLANALLQARRHTYFPWEVFRIFLPCRRNLHANCTLHRHRRLHDRSSWGQRKEVVGQDRLFTTETFH